VFLAAQTAGKKTVGFVPTMGALHEGHISLLRLAKNENDIVVVSIFVNPTQFNNPDDLKNYPRPIDSDKIKLEKAGADVLFLPSVNEMYPEQEAREPDYDFGELEKVMEGKHRPGHFRGVGQIVSKLFRIIHPDAAYFGEKDFQQLAIIRELVKQMKFPVRIVACPTIRESSGLAMSSRNERLTAKERQEASAISKALFFIRDEWKKYSPAEALQKAIQIIEHSGIMQVEYLEIADENTLQPLSEWDDSVPMRCFAAVLLGKVRLIDNVGLK